MTNPKYQVRVTGADGRMLLTYWNLDCERMFKVMEELLPKCDQGATMTVARLDEKGMVDAGEALRITYGEEAGATQVTNQSLGAANGQLTSGATRMTSQARIRATAKELAGQWPEEAAKVRAGQWTEAERQKLLHGNWAD